jgi:hypothetical protein
MIAGIIYLERRSAKNNGIASVPQVSTFSISSHFSIFNVWVYGLLWTTLPSLVMTVYKIAWDTVVSATSDRQPFVELRRPRNKAATAKVTIMLDYRSYPAFRNWIEAFKIATSLAFRCFSVSFFRLQLFHSQRTCSSRHHHNQVQQ